MEHDEEVVLAVLDEDFTAELDADFDTDRERSEPVDPSRWKRRPLPLRLAEAAVTPIRRFL
jgi:cardiolipin synthase